jgi:DHA1 family multidrug resistance protein-like MFS transporter/DHA1 family quinolone resistance protein-like MFS transporter
MNSDKTQLQLLGVTSFLIQLCFAMINLALVFYLRENFSLSASAIGLALSYNQVSYCFFAILLSKKITEFKPRNVILVGLSGITLCIISMIFSSNYYLVLIAIILYGGFLSLVWPSIESWLARGKEESFLNKSMGIFNLSWSSGAAIATFLCGIFIEINLNLPFYFTAILLTLVIISLFIFTTIVPSLRASEAENEYIKRNNLVDNSTFLRYYCWIGIFVGYIVLGAISNIFPIYAKEVLNYSESTVGALLSIRGIVTCFTFYYLRKTDFWHFKFNMIVGIQIMIAFVVLASLAFNNIFTLSIFFFSFGLFFPFVYVMSIFHGASGAINRTRRMVIHEVLLSLGVVGGSFIGGILYDKFSYNQMMLMFFFFIIVCALIEIITYNIRRKITHIAY